MEPDQGPVAILDELAVAPRRLRGRRTLLAGGAGLAAFLLAGALNAHLSPRTVATATSSGVSVLKAPEPAEPAVAEPVGALPWSAGDPVPVADWIAREAALAAQRPPISGVAVFGTTNLELGTRPGISFEADGRDTYLIELPGGDIQYGDAGLRLDYSSATGIASALISDGGPAGADEIAGMSRHGGLQLLPTNDLDRVLHPSRWLEAMSELNEVRVVYTGAIDRGGRTADRYSVTFPGLPDAYSKDGWSLDVDSATGVLLYHRLNYANGDFDEMSVSIDADRATRSQSLTIRAGTAVQGVVVGGSPDGKSVPKRSLQSDQSLERLIADLKAGAR